MKDRNDISTLHDRFRAVMDREAGYMMRVCACFYPGDRAAQEEMMQEVSIRLLGVLERSEGEMPPKLLHTVWQNLCKKHYRKARRHRHLPLPEGFDVAEEREESPFMRLNGLLERLSEEERELMEGYCRCESLQELAESLGVSHGAVRVRVHRTILKLKKIKEETENE